MISTPLSDRLVAPVLDAVVSFLNKEAIPLLREIRSALNATISDLLEPEVVYTAASYTMTATDGVVDYTGAGGHTITLPAANVLGGSKTRPRLILNTGAGGVSVAPAGADTINGSASALNLWGGSVIGSRTAIWLVADGVSQWVTVGAIQPALQIATQSQPTGFTNPIKVTVDGVQVMKADYVTGAYNYVIFNNLVSSSNLTLAGAPAILAFSGSGTHTVSIAGSGLQLPGLNTQKLGFWGVTPVVQQSRPVTLADVISLLVTTGLSA